MGSGGSKYAADRDLPKPLATRRTYYYGRMTPGSPDGKDLGLSEPAPTWDFPTGNGKNVCIIRPEWAASKVFGFTLSHDWNKEAFDSNYPAMLGSAGITEADYKKTIEGLNRVLQAFAPFTCEGDLCIMELRKHLTKANRGFPKSVWELQVHKFVTELSSTLFFENIYFSVKVSLGDASDDATPSGESGESSVAKVQPETTSETIADTQK